MKSISKILLAALIFPLLTLTGCNDDNDNAPQGNLFQTFATLTAANDNGSTFSVQEKDDSQPVTLTSVRKLDTKFVTIGDRYVITYSNGTDNPFKAGAIDLFAIQPVSNGKIQEATAEEIKKLTADPISVMFIGRTGTYVNIQAKAPISNKAKLFNLYVDKASLETESAEVYIGFESDHNSASDKQFFGSFDIATVWNNPAIKQVVVHYEKNGSADKFVMAKGAMSITPMQ